MNKPRSVTEIIAQLERLRRETHACVTRRRELETEAALRAHQLQAQDKQAAASEREHWKSATERIETNAATNQAHQESYYSQRQERLRRALENARLQRQREAEQLESKNTFDNQQGILAAEQRRDEATRQNQVSHEQFSAELANEEAALQELSRQFHQTLAGFGGLARAVEAEAPTALTKTEATPDELLNQLRAQRDSAASHIARCKALVLPLFFRFFRLWFCFVLVAVLLLVLTPALRRFDFTAVPTSVWIGGGVGCIGILALYFLTRKLLTSPAKAAATAWACGRQLAGLCAQRSEAHFQAEAERIQSTFATASQQINHAWKQAHAQNRQTGQQHAMQLNERAARLHQTVEQRHQHQLHQIATGKTEALARLNEQVVAQSRARESRYTESLARSNETRETGWRAIEDQWQTVVLPILSSLHELAAQSQKTFPAWVSDYWHTFEVPDNFLAAAPFSSLRLDLEQFCDVPLAETQLLSVEQRQLNVPLQLVVPSQASVLFETKTSSPTPIIGALNNIILRLLTSAPPGRLAFTIFDPVGLGQNFAGLMHLADFEERLIHSRIWTQPAQIEERLAELNEHIEKVTQMYLRNEYPSLAEYNAQAGRLAEKYHFLVIVDFPTSFTEIAAKRLLSIAASGPRCGVHLLLHWDQRKVAPAEFSPDELRRNAIRIVSRGDGFALAGAPIEATATGTESPDGLGKSAPISEIAPTNWSGVQLTLDQPPDAELTTRLLQQVGKASTDSFRVEMPFEEVAPPAAEYWSLDTTHELRVPIGRTGATKLQYLALGQGTRQHGLVAGKTGSGKSTLFHVIITNLALWCSPDQVEFYLVDFKKGVEFKTYATHQLPQARVIAIESDREFGLSVLQRVDDELKRRGDLFRKLGAQNIAGYKAAVAATPPSPNSPRTEGDEGGAATAMPRVLLLIDEFQELFVEDDRISQGAALLLDRIVRQGRAFGIHVLLGSQTLGGAYTLARATIGQMVVRVALQCNEADAYLIMNEDNPAPRLLSRPGEAIYNDAGGAIQGNSPFQVVWLPDQVRDQWLSKVAALATQRAADLPALAKHVPIVFEGNAPANVADNLVLQSLLDSTALQATSSPHVWLGAPNSIKSPTTVEFRRQSGSHLLIVGQRHEAALTMLGLAALALATQLPKNQARFLVFDCSPADSAEAKFLARIAALIPHEIKILHASEIEATLSALATEQQARAEQTGAAGPETFILVHGLQTHKKLRFDEEKSFSLDATTASDPGLQFNQLITEGAGLGFHVIATCDSYNNVMRFLSRKAVSEFEMRVVFQMSSNDSASLIESPAANNLGLHRAILYNGQEGWTETFRPYALPDAAWLERAQRALARLHA